jgi:phage shock protein A
MRLLKRVNTVITAQLHDVVECFENPERILKQTIRDMETTLEKATESTARAIGGEKQLERRLAEARTSADRWHVRAREAIKNGDEPTARNALARRYHVETGASALVTQLAHCKESNARLRQQLEQLRGRLAAAKGEMGVLIARKRSAEAQRQFAKTETFGNFDVESFNYFDELSLRVAETEAEAEALSELRLHETRDLPRAADIERELERLKVECKGPRE